MSKLPAWRQEEEEPETVPRCNVQAHKGTREVATVCTFAGLRTIHTPSHTVHILYTLSYQSYNTKKIQREFCTQSGSLLGELQVNSSAWLLMPRKTNFPDGCPLLATLTHRNILRMNSEYTGGQGPCHSPPGQERLPSVLW